MFEIRFILYGNRIGSLIVSVLPSSVVDRGFDPRSSQIKDYKSVVSTQH
jgi:hypothetical protein